jgi:hypothetical protein
VRFSVEVSSVHLVSKRRAAGIRKEIPAILGKRLPNLIVMRLALCLTMVQRVESRMILAVGVASVVYHTSTETGTQLSYSMVRLRER